MNQPANFPVNRLGDIEQHPENFLLIERVPITLAGTAFPMAFNDPIGDERPFVIVDTETTGLDAGADKIIELGLVRGDYSPSANRITAITGAISLLEDPGIPIPEVITRITGITDGDVAGQRIDDEEVARWFEGDPLVLAHNAKFDRPFVDARFPALANCGWACTAYGIDWKALGYEGAKLEYLLFKHGFFYDGHRAEVDCLATAWLLHINPEGFAAVLASAREITINILAFGAPFDVKDTLKEHGYRWHPGDTGCNKCWWITVPEKDLEAEQAFLEATDHNGSGSPHYARQNARKRFKGDMM